MRPSSSVDFQPISKLLSVSGLNSFGAPLATHDGPMPPLTPPSRKPWLKMPYSITLSVSLKFVPALKLNLCEPPEDSLGSLGCQACAAHSLPPLNLDWKCCTPPSTFHRGVRSKLKSANSVYCRYCNSLTELYHSCGSGVADSLA